MLTKTSSDISNVIKSWGLWGAPVMRGLRNGLRMMSELRKKGEAALQKSEGQGARAGARRGGERGVPGTREVFRGPARSLSVCPECGRAPGRGEVAGAALGAAFKSTLGGCVAAAS